jgi:hypothetical protein
VVAYLRKGETYADLACGFKVGTSTVYRYVREARELLAAVAPTLEQAIEVAKRKAFVILDGSLLRPLACSCSRTWAAPRVAPRMIERCAAGRTIVDQRTARVLTA